MSEKSRTLLEVSQLSVRYEGSKASTQALDRVSFTIRSGSKTALVGESGSGKSTIAKAILGFLPKRTCVEGSLRFGNKELSRIRREREWLTLRGRQIALIPQDPLISLDPVQRVGAQIVESLKLHGFLDRRAAYCEAIRLLGSVGIRPADEVAQRYPHQLSGGQLQRVLIAIALSGNPSLIVADEPTSGLDVRSQKLVLNELDNLLTRTGTSLILITHDLAIAQNHADRIIVLNSGKIVDDLAADNIAAAMSPYTEELFAAVPSQAVHRLRPDRTGRSELETGLQVPRSRPLVSFNDVSKHFSRGFAAGDNQRSTGVDRISFDIYTNQTFGLVGESGSGKTTTAKIAAGILVPDEGSFVWHEETLQAPSQRSRGKEIQFVFQNPFSSLNPKLTIEQILREPLDALGIGDKASRPERIDRALESVGLSRLYTMRKPGELSGGQCQRVAIARAIIVEPKLLILDEPVSALDVTVQAQILRLLVDLQHRLDGVTGNPAIQV